MRLNAMLIMVSVDKIYRSPDLDEGVNFFFSAAINFTV